MNRGKLEKKIILWGILITVILLGLLAAVGNVLRRQRAEKQLVILVQQTNVPAQTSEESSDRIPEEEKVTVGISQDILFLEENQIPVPEKYLDFDRMQKEANADIYAWIYIPDTRIDYPVLQHPEDNSYYLSYNMDGSKGYPGCIYTELYNSKDFMDFNTVLYGHNMRDGSMFTGLHDFANTDFFETHPYVYIYTEERILVYEIFAAYEFGDVHLLTGYDVESDMGRLDYLEEIYHIPDQSCFRPRILPQSAQDHILTLSTCMNRNPSKRYLVQAVLLNES